MGPLTFEQLREKLGAQHPERKLAALAQLWAAFGLRAAFLESTGANAFTACVIGQAGIGSLREVSGLLNLQITPFGQFTGYGVRERSDNCQLFFMLGEKELHLTWPGGLSSMLEDPEFRWLEQQLSDPVRVN